MSETPLIAAQRLAAKKIKKGFELQALHEYTDKEGNALYWRIRLKNLTTGEKWIRPLHLNDQNIFVLSEPTFENLKPLYRLPEIINNPDATIWIVEGEWCADHLAALGIVATTSGSADSVGKVDWMPLQNRSAIIWRDNDEAGLRYANAVSEQLRKINCVVQWIDATQLNLAKKADCVDWLALKTNADKEIIHTLQKCEPTNNIIINPAIANTSNNIDVKAIGFLSSADGVYFIDDKGKHRICSPLFVKAWVRDSASENWGRLLEFHDPDNHLHRPVIPMEMLKGNGDEVKGLLLNLGLIIEPGLRAKQLLLAYISDSKH